MIVIILYTCLIFFFIFGLIRLPKTEVDTSLALQKFSIVIPFRNEENNLKALLKSITKLNYDLNHFEILLIDDESTDNSVNLIKKWQEQLPNLSLLKNNRISNSPKKDAIRAGVKASKYDWIITTDADCTLPKNWLHCYNSTIHQNGSLFIAGPIELENKKGFIHQYQLFDCLSLLGTTLGSFGVKKPMMCNAANMGFDKSTYLQIQNGSNTNIASGDDVFTLESFVKKHPKQIQYLNTIEALVSTKTETSWKDIFQQRIRWAAKSTHYKSIFTKFVGLIVLITQFTLLITLFYKPLLSLFLWLVKIGVDGFLLLLTAQKLQQKISYWYYLSIAFVYPFINTFIGTKALFGGYTWKHRKFKK